MKSAWFAILAAALALSTSAAALADDTPIRNGCQPPDVPAPPLDRAEAASLQTELDKYKQCIQTFADVEHAEAERHRKAANAAIAEFNEFVSTKLPKAPDK